jgi:3-isopropylmalate/(R)-2-methylmalate dehydratase small subunit
MQTIKGRAWKYGDHVNTDVIFPGKYTYTISDPAEMAPHALEDLDPEFARNVKPGDVVVGGKNFGCGSSREQAPQSIKAAGAGVIIAKGFARIFYRNCINIGLPALTSPEAVEAIEHGNAVEVNLDAGTIVVKGQTFTFPPFAGYARTIIESGGLIPHTRKVLGIDR